MEPDPDLQHQSMWALFFENINCVCLCSSTIKQMNDRVRREANAHHTIIQRPPPREHTRHAGVGHAGCGGQAEGQQQQQEGRRHRHHPAQGTASGGLRGVIRILIVIIIPIPIPILIRIPVFILFLFF